MERTEAMEDLFVRSADGKRWELNPLSNVWVQAKEYVEKKSLAKGDEG